MKRIVAAVLLVSLAILGWVVWAQYVRTPEPGPAAPAPASQPSVAKPAPQRAVQPASRAPTAKSATEDTEAVAGVVVDADGKPQSATKVKLLRLISPWPVLETEEIDSVFCGDDGSFRFRTRRGPGLYVEASHPELASVLLEAPPFVPRLTIQMRKGHTVRGRVVDPDTQRGLANCEVVLEPGPFDERRASRKLTDADGRFELPEQLPGIARLSARHPRWQPAVVPSANISSEPYRLRFEQPALELRGKVFDPRGRGIADAKVRAYPTSWNGGLFVPFEAKTDAQGSFTLTGLGPGNLRLECRHEQYSTQSLQVPVRKGTSELRFELVARARVRGRLAGASPKAEAQVALATDGGEYALATVERDGAFRFPGTFSIGRARLELHGRELALQKNGGTELAIEIGEESETVLEVAVVPAVVFRGTVLDEDGQPIAGALVMRPRSIAAPMVLQRLAAITDPHGRFELRGLPRGTLLTVRYPGFGFAQVVAEPPQSGTLRELEPIVMPRAAKITGHVRRGPRNLVGAFVHVIKDQGIVDTAITGPLGVFQIGDLPPGDYRVKARYGTLAVISSDVIPVEAGDEISPVDLVYPPGHELRGEVVDGAGRPVDGVEVVLRGGDSEVLSPVENGRFELDVPRGGGDVELLIVKSGTGMVWPHRVLQGRRTVKIELPLIPHGTVTGKFVGPLPGRKPVTQAILRVEPLDLPADAPADVRMQRRVVGRPITLVRGLLELPEFPAGRSRLVLQAPGHAPFTRELEVKADESVDLGPVVLEPGASVQGRVVDADGNPVAGARVRLGREVDLTIDFGEAEIVSDADGRFALRGVSGQARDLVVVAPGFAPTTRRLELPGDLLRTTPLPLRLDRGLDLTVKVVGGDENNPLAQRTVELRRDGIVLCSEHSDEQGLATFRRFAPGSYELRVSGFDEAAQPIQLGPNLPPGPILLHATSQPSTRPSK